MKRQNALSILILIALTGCGKPTPPAAPQPNQPLRLISLAPDITEMLYKLNLGASVVGATTWCTYPEAAKKLPRVGGYGQFNMETILALKPDLVLLHHTYEAEKIRFNKLGIAYLETNPDSLSSILSSITRIGEACNAAPAAQQLHQTIYQKIQPQPAQKKEPPRVLITFGNEANSMRSIHAFGTHCLHHELLEIAGGQNVIDTPLAFTTLSTEAIIRLNPEIIIQLAPNSANHNNTAWNRFKTIDAVQNKAIHTLTGDYVCSPGPRLIQTLSDFQKIITQYNQ